MKPITLFLLILLISLVIIATLPYSSYYNGKCTMEKFKNNDDLNLNIRFNNTNAIRRPRVMVPLYAPWRMYYPYESVYSLPIPWQYQSSPFYPFFDQYNIYQNMVPYNN
jgi:hypothetical protein